jgi:hypothetical protein
MPSSDESSRVSQGWIAAAVELGRFPRENVLCPVCSDRYLEVLDVPLSEAGLIDRHLICPGCGARSVLSRLRYKLIQVDTFLSTSSGGSRR